MKNSITYVFICLNMFLGTFTHASEFLNALENATAVKQVQPENQRSTNQQNTVTDNSFNCYPNEEILKVTQRYLYELGLYKFSIDGVAGKGTKSAIMKAKTLFGARASPGNCLTDQDIVELRLLAENRRYDTDSSTKIHVSTETDLDLSEITIMTLQKELDKKIDELNELTERYGMERRATLGNIQSLRADLSALSVQNAKLKAELASINKSKKTELSTASATIGSSEAPSLALNTQSAGDIVKISEKPVNGEVPITNISLSITAVMVQINKPTFDVYSCAFHLEFTNRTSGNSFDVVLYAEGSDGKFTASTKDIQNALADSRLTTEDNNWSQLTVKAKKYDDPNVVCQPANQTSYSITEDGAEGVFNIDSNGQITMTGLPIVELSENGVAEEATNTEPIFSQSITSVIAEISNPDFDVANCTFNLEFTDGISGKSFNVKMDPQGGTSSKFTAGRNDIEDGLADAGLTAEDNQWAVLTVKVKKFDYPFVSCQPANQDFHFISKDEADGKFKVDRNGQLSITGLPVVAVVDGADAESAKPEVFEDTQTVSEFYTYFGTLPGEQDLVKLNVVYDGLRCGSFDNKKSVAKNLHNLIHSNGCINIDHPDLERVPGPGAVVIDDLRRMVVMKVRKKFSMAISSIIAKPSIGNFDIFNCAFNLLFTNKESGAKFEIMMFYIGDGSFTSAETINDKLAQRRLDLGNNNWNNLKVRVTKSRIKGTACKPQENAPVSIKKDKTKGKFTISRDGRLYANDVKLESNMDDLVVFLSNNIGRAVDGSGEDSSDPNYPFSTDLDLQTFYFTHALDALERYAEKPATYRSIRIYKSKGNTFTEKVASSLPNKNISISYNTVFDEKNVQLDYFMPDVARFLRSRKVANSTAVLVIGSFGLGAQDLCDHSLYASIHRSRSDAAVYIFNFVPFENFYSLDYKLMHKAPATIQCPDKDNIFLIYPNKIGQLAPEKIADGFYKLISEGLVQ